MYQPTLKALPSLMFAVLAALLTSVSLIGAQTITAKPIVVPNRTLEVLLIKATLLTFNDANLTGNYTVLHARLSKPFREQITPERLAEVFKPFHAQQINLRSIITKRHTATIPARIDDGVLKLSGYLAVFAAAAFLSQFGIGNRASAQPFKTQVREVPKFEADASWAKLPKKWIWGQVSSVSIDEQGNASGT